MNIHSPITPKEQLRSVQLRDLLLTEFAQPASFKVPSHSHENATVLFTLNGYAEDRIAGRVLECKPSSVLIRPSGEFHTHHYGRTGFHGLVIEIKPERLKQIRRISSSLILDRVGYFTDGTFSDLGTRLLMESRMPDSASELAIEGLVLEMLARAVRHTKKRLSLSAPPGWLQLAKDFIEGNYTENVSLASVAAAAGVHPAHLAELFRKFFHCSVGEYIRRLRLDHASRDVLMTNKSLAEISSAAGFYDQSHFTRLFKRRVGRSPSEVRKLSRIANAHTKSLQLSNPS